MTPPDPKPSHRQHAHRVAAPDAVETVVITVSDTRTLETDIRPIVEISQKAGIAIEAATFLGSSPIRQFAEDWSLDHMLRLTEEAITYAVGHGLPVMFVTEDTCRATPEAIRRLVEIGLKHQPLVPGKPHKDAAKAKAGKAKKRKSGRS